MGDEQMTQEQKGKTPVLDVQNLTKIYDNGGKGDGNEVLKNVNFTMNEGEFVCLRFVEKQVAASGEDRLALFVHRDVYHAYLLPFGVEMRTAFA